MILIFDLDDTLYDELTFVKSGFKAVSSYLEENFNIENPFTLMVNLLKQKGRGKIFDEVLKINSIYSKKNLKNCIKIYRYHKPNIFLYEDAENCLKKYKSLKKYIVTDGNKLVQKNKIEALKIASKFEKCYITRNYGIKYEKPSLFCFDLIKKKEQCGYKDLVYIGDNPNKDFVNLKKKGALTIRIKRGMFKNIVLSSDCEADYTINSLDEIEKYLH